MTDLVSNSAGLLFSGAREFAGLHDYMGCAGRLAVGGASFGSQLAVYGQQGVTRQVQKYNWFHLGGALRNTWKLVEGERKTASKYLAPKFVRHVSSFTSEYLGINEESVRTIVCDSLIKQREKVKKCIRSYFVNIVKEKTGMPLDLPVEEHIAAVGGALQGAAGGLEQFGGFLGSVDSFLGDSPVFAGLRRGVIGLRRGASSCHDMVQGTAEIVEQAERIVEDPMVEALRRLGLPEDIFDRLENSTEEFFEIIADEISGPIVKKTNELITLCLTDLALDNGTRLLISWLASSYLFPYAAGKFGYKAFFSLLKQINDSAYVVDLVGPTFLHTAGRVAGALGGPNFRDRLLSKEAVIDIDMGEKVCEVNQDDSPLLGIIGGISKDIMENLQDNSVLLREWKRMGDDLRRRCRSYAPEYLRRFVPESLSSLPGKFPLAFIKRSLVSAICYATGSIALKGDQTSFDNYCEWLNKIDPQLAELMKKTRREAASPPQAVVAAAVDSDEEETKTGAFARAHRFVGAVGHRFDGYVDVVNQFSKTFEAVKAAVDDIQDKRCCELWEAHVRSIMRLGLRNFGLKGIKKERCQSRHAKRRDHNIGIRLRDFRRAAAAEF